ncbi:MAG: hypothetical protein JO202_08220 [Ktedonobacteraceae bacterium]|nr:hypothetical protein [Ktedonobacteraceae bacterium]
MGVGKTDAIGGPGGYTRGSHWSQTHYVVKRTERAYWCRELAARLIRRCYENYKR